MLRDVIEIPKLFRYYGHSLFPSERPLENPAFKVLESCALKIALPVEFNDPFEFSPVWEGSVTDVEAENRLAKTLAHTTKQQSLPVKLADDLAKVIVNLKRRPSDLKYVVQQTVLPDLSQRYGVICFSAIPDCALMWSHYAAQHYGVMLEFDPKAEIFQSDCFFPVEYTDGRVRLTEPPVAQKDVIALASRKSPAWAYENEYRLLVPLNGVTSRRLPNGSQLFLLKLKPEWVKSITVGLRASVEVKSEVNKFVRRPEWKHLHAARFRMVMDAEKFQLRRELVEHF